MFLGSFFYQFNEKSANIWKEIKTDKPAIKKNVK